MTRKTDRTPNGGLSKETVEAIYEEVLGVSARPVPQSAEGSPKPDRATPSHRLSKETVEAIYEYVMSGGEPRRTPHGQFTKGRSGNPKGRPKRPDVGVIAPRLELDPESLSAITLRHGARKVKAQTEDGEVEISLKEAALIKMVREAARGNTGHSRTLIQTIARAEAEEAKRQREAFRHWSAVKEQAAQLYAEAEAAGEEPPLSVHPDDIELHADGTVAIVGPVERGDIVDMHLAHRRVAYHLVNIAYFRWIEQRCIRLGGKRGDGFLYAELDFLSEQLELPPRLRLSEDAILDRLRGYSRMSGRALHALLRQQAEPINRAIPSREQRWPMRIPQADLERAKSRDVGLKQFLPVWLSAMATAYDMFSKQRGAALGPIA